MMILPRDVRMTMNLSKEDFEHTISMTDSSLASANVPIPKRPIQAIVAIFKRYNVGGPIAHPFKPNMQFPVVPANLSDHVNAWYQDHYKNKIKVDPSPGRFPLAIEGAAYECRVPMIFGGTLILSSKNKFQDKRLLNIIDHITDLPQIVRNRLSGEIENYIQAIFVTCIEASKELAAHRTSFHESALSDSRIASDLLCGYNINASMSSWHSLQLAEKVLKQYISKHETPPFTHEIKKLVELAKKHGYWPDEKLNMSLFNFGASTRYEPHQISIEQAVLINHEAWRISFNVLRHAQA